jgi:hypothetical protein
MAKGIQLEIWAKDMGFLFEYNHLRRHGGLDYITSFDKLEKVTALVS